MAMIPMKQKILVEKTSTVSDGWGGKTLTNAIEMKCRVDENAETVFNQEGEETIVNLKIMLDKMADIGYEDTITYENELGIKTTKKPSKIQPMRDFSGKPIMTVVYL